MLNINVQSKELLAKYRQGVEKLSQEESFVSWYQTAISTQRNKSPQAVSFGSLMGLSEFYISHNLVPEAVATIRKCEILFFELLEKGHDFNPLFILSIPDRYSRFGLLDDASRVANRSLEIIRQKLTDSALPKPRVEELIKLWSEFIFTILEGQKEQRVRSLAMIESLPSNFSGELTDDWEMCSHTGYDDVTNPESTYRQSYDKQAEAEQ